MQEGRDYFDLANMIYPPEKDTLMGRGNLAGKPVLYASDGLATALDEISAQPGDRIQTIQLALKPDCVLRACIIGVVERLFNAAGRPAESMMKHEAQAIQMVEGMSIEDQTKNLYLDSFLAESFRASVKRSCDYLLTASFSETVYNSGCSVVCPSVERNHGFNVAIPKDTYIRDFLLKSRLSLRSRRISVTGFIS